MFEKKGSFELETTATKETVDLRTMKIGVNETPNYFFELDKHGSVAWVVARTCDHRHGKLSLQDDGKFAICPRHGWKLAFSNLRYTNVDLGKPMVNFSVKNNLLKINHTQKRLRLPELFRTEQPNEVKIRFISHACLAITIDGFTIISDPWIVGPAVRNSWWHSLVPRDDALDILFNADLVFISHNHSDHLNYETLSVLVESRQSIPFIFPNWESESVGRVLSGWGFTELFPAEIGKIYKVSNVLLSVFESGDFKEDGGLYFSAGNFSGLLTADSAILNQLVLPEVDFLATGFIGNASAYPWCFDNLLTTEKRRINMRGVWAAREELRDYVETTNATYILPYAGYSTLNLPNDRYLKENTIGNSLLDIKKLVKNIDEKKVCIEPTPSLVAHFTSDKQLKITEDTRGPLYELDDRFMQQFIEEEEAESANYSEDYVIKYFEESDYQDNLILYLIPTDVEFQEESMGFIINFSGPQVRVNLVSRQMLNHVYEFADETNFRHLFIRTRKGPFWKTVNDRKPWGEFMYHCRIHRKPNIYNAGFWEHFSNIFIMRDDKVL